MTGSGDCRISSSCSGVVVAGHNVNCVTCLSGPPKVCPAAPHRGIEPRTFSRKFQVFAVPRRRADRRPRIPVRRVCGGRRSCAVQAPYRLRRNPAKIWRPVLEYCVTSGSSSYAQRSSVWFVRFSPSIDNDRKSVACQVTLASMLRVALLPGSRSRAGRRRHPDRRCPPRSDTGYIAAR